MTSKTEVRFFNIETMLELSRQLIGVSESMRMHDDAERLRNVRDEISGKRQELLENLLEKIGDSDDFKSLKGRFSVEKEELEDAVNRVKKVTGEITKIAEILGILNSIMGDIISLGGGTTSSN